MTTGAYSTIQPVYANGVPIPELGLAVGPQTMLGPWEGTASYVVGDEVTDSGHLYRCLVATPAIYAEDTFTGRTVTGGWGTASDGHSVWTDHLVSTSVGHAAGLSVVNGRGIWSYDGAGVLGSGSGSDWLVWGDGAPAASVDLVLHWSMLLPQGDGFVLEPVLGADTPWNFAETDAEVDTTGSQTWTYPDTGGAATSGSISRSVPLTEGVAYITRVRAQPPLAAQRTWIATDPEPTTWDSSTTLSGDVPTLRQVLVAPAYIAGTPDQRIIFTYVALKAIPVAPASDPDHWTLLS